jgi:hypothetical protein
VHAVLAGSPCRAKLRPKDIIIAVNGTPIDRVRFLVFSNRRPSPLTIKSFEADLFAVRDIRILVGPEHYRPLDGILEEARRVADEQPPPTTVKYKNPRFLVPPRPSRAI